MLKAHRNFSLKEIGEMSPTVRFDRVFTWK